MQTAEKPNERTLGSTTPKTDPELTSHRIIFALGLLLCVTALLLEIFTGKTIEDHGMWAMFSLVGFGITVVFGLILKGSRELPAH
jgi:drug/metabolite transporter (DMT)-like permease